METPEIRLHVDRSELEQMIRERAFELYVERRLAQELGSPESDWELAAQEIDPFVEVEPS